MKMNYVTSLNPELRRALARSELRRRGVPVRVQHDDGQCKALRAGLAALDGYTDFDNAVIALAARDSANTLTTADRAMLDSLPVCEILNMNLIHAFSEVLQEF